jgi:GDP-L-fucose synthase
VKFLVAGATGLAGSAIMRALNLKGIESIGISSANLNLLDRKATFDYLREEKPDIVIDAAARVGGIGANSEMPVQFISENLQIQVNLMDAAHQADVSKFVFLGSACIYPKICEQPIREESLLTGLLEPTNSAYAVAKIAGLETINAYRKQYRRRWISVQTITLTKILDTYFPRLSQSSNAQDENRVHRLCFGDPGIRGANFCMQMILLKQFYFA